MSLEYDCEAVVIGSGFGGAVLACRLSKKWPGKVMVLERGKRVTLLRLGAQVRSRSVATKVARGDVIGPSRRV